MKRLVLLLLNLLMPMILFAASNDLCFRHFSEKFFYNLLNSLK